MKPRGRLARRTAGRVLDHAADVSTTHDLPHCGPHDTPGLASCRGGRGEGNSAITVATPGGWPRRQRNPARAARVRAPRGRRPPSRSDRLLPTTCTECRRLTTRTSVGNRAAHLRAARVLLPSSDPAPTPRDQAAEQRQAAGAVGMRGWGGLGPKTPPPLGGAGHGGRGRYQGVRLNPPSSSSSPAPTQTATQSPGLPPGPPRTAHHR